MWFLTTNGMAPEEAGFLVTMIDAVDVGHVNDRGEYVHDYWRVAHGRYDAQALRQVQQMIAQAKGELNNPVWYAPGKKYFDMSAGHVRTLP